MSTAAEFRDHLTDFSEHYASLGGYFNYGTFSAFTCKESVNISIALESLHLEKKINKKGLLPSHY